MSIVINFTDNEHIKLILFNVGDEPISLNDKCCKIITYSGLEISIADLITLNWNPKRMTSYDVALP